MRWLTTGSFENIEDPDSPTARTLSTAGDLENQRAFLTALRRERARSPKGAKTKDALEAAGAWAVEEDSRAIYGETEAGHLAAAGSGPVVRKNSSLQRVSGSIQS
ncbi:hypothetical protein [Mesorhizobium sp. WSM3860]|uniref:hypothetical protein n=1 Tax=Mesorhizobium sp. WSM3860 TaxID=2029403 RepID=UPI001140A19F|nr:hypothetical protein [Mesorhizobium sp. WSM3860]